MIMCPSCHHQEVEGALFCTECGMSLQNIGTQTIDSALLKEDSLVNASMEKKALKEDLLSAYTLQLLEMGQLLPIAGRHEYTMGRVSEGQSVMPDIDLTDYRAYENGVSRIHAVLKQKNGQIFLMDLGSSNGTYLNGMHLIPEQEYPLSNGSILSLGKLKIQLLVRK